LISLCYSFSIFFRDGVIVNVFFISLYRIFFGPLQKTFIRFYCDCSRLEFIVLLYSLYLL